MPHTSAARMHTDQDGNISKSQVDRAGNLLRDLTRAVADLGPRLIDGSVDEEVARAYRVANWWREVHARPLSNVAAGLRYHVDKENAGVNGRVEVAQRLKRLPTIIGKLEREPTMKLSRMGDIGGVRAVVPSLSHLYAVNRRLQKTWTIRQVRDYVADPKSSGYRAVHLIVVRNERLIEVQLRTQSQDAWANQIEEDGRLQSTGLKFGEGSEVLHNYYRAAADAFAAVDRGEQVTGKIEEALVETFRNARPLFGR